MLREAMIRSIRLAPTPIRSHAPKGKRVSETSRIPSVIELPAALPSSTTTGQGDAEGYRVVEGTSEAPKRRTRRGRRSKKSRPTSQQEKNETVPSEKEERFESEAYYE